MTETPEEMYKRLDDLCLDIDHDINVAELYKLVDHYRSQVKVLRENLSDISSCPSRDYARSVADEILAATEPNKWSE